MRGESGWQRVMVEGGLQSGHGMPCPYLGDVMGQP